MVLKESNKLFEKPKTNKIIYFISYIIYEMKK